MKRLAPGITQRSDGAVVIDCAEVCRARGWELNAENQDRIIRMVREEMQRRGGTVSVDEVPESLPRPSIN